MDISQVLPILGDSRSEVSYFIPEPRKFSEVTRFSDDINKPLAKSNSKGYQKYNQQSDFSSSISKEGWAFDSIHGCLQSKSSV